MLGNDFYFALFRKYVAVFGTLFNDIYIYRSAAGQTDQQMKVPISYGPREKTLARLEADPNLNRPTAIVLPRMSFEITNIRYAPERKLQTTHFKTKKSADGTVNTQYMPVPYDLDFTLSVMAKNAEDATKIVEQILPFFTPDFTPTVHLIPEMSISLDVPVVLNNVMVDDQYEGNFEERRAIIWTLQFTMKAYIFGPIKGPLGGVNGRPVIKIATVNERDMANNIYTTVQVRPGLTANGEPTANLSESIHYLDIDADDNFGYIVTIE